MHQINVSVYITMSCTMHSCYTALYLAVCLREQVAKQGQKQLRRQQSKPDWPRLLAFWQTWWDMGLRYQIACQGSKDYLAMKTEGSTATDTTITTAVTQALAPHF